MCVKNVKDRDAIEAVENEGGQPQMINVGAMNKKKKWFYEYRQLVPLNVRLLLLVPSWFF